jgi:RecB family exonuclease
VIGLVREEAARELRRTLGAADVSSETRLRREVDEAVPSLAASVGALLRLTLSRAIGADRPTAFAEVPVDAEIAPGIRWRGRIDAVVVSGGSVTLLDFKTGAPSPHDAEKLAAYACLFERDERTRGWGSVRRLALLYARGGVDERDAPTGPALDAERARLARECAEVSRRLEASPPEASPSPEHCPRCDVRGRCDPYWSTRQTWGDGAPHVARSIDVELSVIDVLEGERGLVANADGQSWFVRLDASHAEVVRGLRRGSRIRLMGVMPQAPRGFDDERSADVMVDVGPGCVSVSRP